MNIQEEGVVRTWSALVARTRYTDTVLQFPSPKPVIPRFTASPLGLLSTPLYVLSVLLFPFALSLLYDFLLPSAYLASLPVAQAWPPRPASEAALFPVLGGPSSRTGAPRGCRAVIAVTRTTLLLAFSSIPAHIPHA